MAERKYSVAEIGRMRDALRWTMTPHDRSFYPDELNAQIERALQTYMLNGTEPSELEDERDTYLRNLQASRT